MNNSQGHLLTGKEGGRGGEKNIDAIYIDEKNKQCSIVQGKFHTLEGFAEKINDVLSFAGLGLLPWESKSLLETFYSKLDPIVLEKFRELVGCAPHPFLRTPYLRANSTFAAASG